LFRVLHGDAGKASIFRPVSIHSKPRREIKVFLLLFLQKKKFFCFSLAKKPRNFYLQRRFDANRGIPARLVPAGFFGQTRLRI
jgi:hypothetical protein